MKTILIGCCLSLVYLFFPLWVLPIANAQTQVAERSPGELEWIQEQEQSQQDTIKTNIEKKISFFEQQLRQNNDIILQLEKELEERRRLNERLTAAVIVSKEILNDIIPVDSLNSKQFIK